MKQKTKEIKNDYKRDFINEVVVYDPKEDVYQIKRKGTVNLLRLNLET
jgi:hypothetical protein